MQQVLFKFGLWLSTITMVFGGRIVEHTATVTKSTAGVVTYTATEMVSSGLILRDPNGGNRSDTTATATAIIRRLQNAKVGSSFDFIFRNTADGNETVTLVGGTGVTFSGLKTIADSTQKTFKVVVTGLSTPAVTIYPTASLTFQ